MESHLNYHNIRIGIAFSFFFLIFAPLCILAQMPAAISITPENAYAYDEITLTLDTRLSCPDDALFNVDSVMMHSGVTIDGEMWLNVIGFDAYGANGQQPKLIPNGDSTWYITFTPADFFGLDSGSNVEALNCVFNGGTWNNEGKDFDAIGDCIDFYVPFNQPESPVIDFSIVMTKAIDEGIFDPYSDQLFIEIEGFDPIELESTWWENWICTVSDGLTPGMDLSFTFSINQVQYEEISREISIIPGYQNYQSWWDDDPYINYSGAITISPENPSPRQEVTLTIDTRLSCPGGVLFDADSIMLHSGITLDDNYWQYVVEHDAVGLNGQQPKLSNNGDSTWSISFIPAEFYGFPTELNPEAINCVFNIGDWIAEGKDFTPDGFCVDFYVPLGLSTQNSHTINFETNGIGADWEWFVQGNGDNPPLEFIDNPVSGGINNSPKVAKFTARQAGLGYAYTHTIDDGQFTFDQSNHIVKVMVHKPVVSPISIKFDGPGGFAEILAWNTQVNQWEELEFDFTGFIGHTYNRFRILPDYEVRNEDHIIYLDNIQMPNGEVVVLAEPTTAPPNPQHAEENVISIYTEVYPNAPDTDFFPNWGQATQVTFDYPVAGNNTLKYNYLDYQGTHFPSLDVSSFEKLHIDLWTPNSTELKFHLISPGPISSYVELPISTDEWLSVDLDLQDFAPPVDTTEVIQFMVEGNGTIYFDNWYFWKEPFGQGYDPTLSNLVIDGEPVPEFSPNILNYDVDLPYGTVDIPTTTPTTTDPEADYIVNDATSLPGTTTVEVTSANGANTLSYTIYFEIASPEPQVAAPDPSHPEGDVLSIYSDVYQNLEGVYFNPYWLQQTIVTVDYPIAGNNTLKYKDLDYQGTDFPSQDVLEYDYFHVDFWTSNSTDLGFFLISPGPMEKEYVFSISPETWVSVDIPLEHFVPPVNLAEIYQFKVEGNGDIWFDNWYFWKNPTGIATPYNTLKQLSIYPNPAKNTLTISGLANSSSIKIFDILGTCVLSIQESSTRDQSIDIQNLSPGIYILIVSNDNQNEIVKFIKE